MSEINFKLPEKFVKLTQDESKYLFVLGGAGSGKSVFASFKLILRCITEPGHRFVAVRKVAKTIRESVFKELQLRIVEMDLVQFFEINKTEMKLLYKPTGSEIITYGLDDPEKLKSLAKITGIWIEELCPEVDKNSFDQLILRLRGQTDYYKQVICTFNPVDERHWSKSRVDEGRETDHVHHSTMLDNPFIDKEYIDEIKLMSKSNPNYYRIFFQGAWGRAEVQSPYLYNFELKKHTGKVSLDDKFPLIFSFDFNVDPFVCIIGQIYRDHSGHHVHVCHEITLFDGDVHKMCERIKSKFSTAQLSRAYFTGDAMQKKKEITQQNNIDAWQMIRSQLNVSSKRMAVPRSNPRVSENRHLVNFILSQHPDVMIDADECSQLIIDCQYVEADDEGNILKKNRNKESQRADHLDAFRYLCNAFMGDFVMKPSKYI